MDIESYVTHLSRLGRPQFHEELFVLILYNMKVKMKMVKGATWRVREKATAAQLATELNAEEIDRAISNRRSRIPGYGAGDQLLKAVDAIARGVAHTNEAAKRARRTVECMQHNFGMPTHFLTVTPDDDNNILLQVYSQEDLDLNTSTVDGMDVDELHRRASNRTKLRIKQPGIAAMAFEHILDIIIETVIGWDTATNEGKIGLFGKVIAFTSTIEEQGRRTLHVHFQIWIEKFIAMRNALHSNERQMVREARSYMCREASRTMSTSLFFNKRDFHSGGIWSFPHECSVRSNRRRHPVVVNDQTIRDLRYKGGSVLTGAMFASCPHCSKSWTYEELVKDYLMYNVKDGGLLASRGEGDYMERMRAKAMEYQKLPGQHRIQSYVIEAGYNLHKHTTSCFKRGQQTNIRGMTARQRRAGKKRLLECECRY
jgi:hypothetical protein